MSRLTRDGTAEPVSRDQILRRERGQTVKNVHFFCSADLEQNWQPYPVHPSLAVCDGHTYIPQVSFKSDLGFGVRTCRMRLLLVCLTAALFYQLPWMTR